MFREVTLAALVLCVFCVFIVQAITIQNDVQSVSRQPTAEEVTPGYEINPVQFVKLPTSSAISMVVRNPTTTTHIIARITLQHRNLTEGTSSCSTTVLNAAIQSADMQATGMQGALIYVSSSGWKEEQGVLWYSMPSATTIQQNCGQIAWTTTSLTCSQLPTTATGPLLIAHHPTENYAVLISSRHVCFTEPNSNQTTVAPYSFVTFRKEAGSPRIVQQFSSKLSVYASVMSNHYLYVAGITTYTPEQAVVIVRVYSTHAIAGVNELASWTTTIRYQSSSKWYPSELSLAMLNDHIIALGVPGASTVYILTWTTNPINLSLVGSKENTCTGIQTACAAAGFGAKVGLQMSDDDSVHLISEWQDYTSGDILVGSYIIGTLSELNMSLSAQEEFRLPNSYNSLKDGSIQDIDVTATKIVLLRNIAGDGLSFLEKTPYAQSYWSIDDDEPLACPPGMYKLTSALYFCSLCPINTYSQGGTSPVGCIACVAVNNQTVSCPIGAPMPFNSSYTEPVTQAYKFGIDTPDDSFDNLMLTLTFSLDGQCPPVKTFLFWAILLAGVGTLYLCIDALLRRFCTATRVQRVLKKSRAVLKSVDLVGDRTSYITGLISLPYLFFLIAAIYLGISFATRYPYEAIDLDQDFWSCCTPLYNFQFSRTLDDITMSAEEPIEKLLASMNSRPINIKLTAFGAQRASCNGSTTSTSPPEDPYKIEIVKRVENVKYKNHSCIGPTSPPTSTQPRKADESTISFVANRVSPMYNKFQFTINEETFISGFAITITADEMRVADNIVAKAINFTQPYFRSDSYVLERNIDISVTMKLAVNITESLDANSDSSYSGIWIPEFSPKTGDDDYLGTSLVSWSSSSANSYIVTISILETTQYLRYTQAPVTRIGGLVFSVVLYFTAMYDLFGFAVLVCKIIIFSIRDLLSKNKKERTKRDKKKVDSNDEYSTGNGNMEDIELNIKHHTSQGSAFRETESERLPGTVELIE